MLQGIETIYEQRVKLLKGLKKKSYVANTESFIGSYGHYFKEMAEYVKAVEEETEQKSRAGEIGDCIVEAVKATYTNKRGKIDGRTQADLNFMMIYYVFPTILKQEPVGKIIADEVLAAWKKNFKDGQIGYTDYDSIYESFREKIFGLF